MHEERFTLFKQGIDSNNPFKWIKLRQNEYNLKISYLLVNDSPKSLAKKVNGSSIYFLSDIKVFLGEMRNGKKKETQ